MTLLDRIFETVQWTPVTAPTPPKPGMPYATHEGWASLGEDTLHVFQLNTGERVCEEGSLSTLMNGPFGCWFIFLKEHPEWEPDVMLAPEGLGSIKPGELVARPAATKAFVQWAVDRGLAQHPERLPGLLEHLNYQTTLERQACGRRKPKLRLIRPRQDPQ
jgi:hypothetical protein